jgi:hypothetical protein
VRACVCACVCLFVCLFVCECMDGWMDVLAYWFLYTEER